MGRSRTPIPQSAQCYELAQWLRSLRQRSGLTYRQMAELTEGLRIADPACSAVTLLRGPTVAPSCPSPCRGSVCAGLWRHTARGPTTLGAGGPAIRPHSRRPRGPSAPRAGRKLELVYHPAHLLEAMHQARLAAGQPSLREMEKKARDLGAGPLPRSTVADILAGFRMPSEEVLVAYVRLADSTGAGLRSGAMHGHGHSVPTPHETSPEIDFREHFNNAKIRRPQRDGSVFRQYRFDTSTVSVRPDIMADKPSSVLVPADVRKFEGSAAGNQLRLPDVVAMNQPMGGSETEPVTESTEASPAAGAHGAAGMPAVAGEGPKLRATARVEPASGAVRV